MLPYVRMVAVTGALAMNNVEPRDDIDFLIVTEPERLWITRGMILLIARCARMWGDTLCPNYIISSRALRFGRRDPYTAHELAQMTPLHGGEIARRLWQENEWCRDLLPNAQWRDDSIADDRVPPVSMRLKSLGQALLDLPPGTFLERWERRRKIDKLSGDGSGSGEALYTADVCKGHAHGHGARIMDRWTAQIAEGTGPLERASIAPRWM
jgi:hypothetical protein